MRIIRESNTSQYKITIFDWNNRYLIKVESGYFEQTYKIDKWDITEDGLNNLLDSTFFLEAGEIFQSMEKTLSESLKRL